MDKVLNASDVEKAVVALKECLEKKKEKELVHQLIDEENVSMQFSFKKVPAMKRQAIKVVLPHAPERMGCIFVKDKDRKSRDYELTKQEYEEIFKERGIAGLKIIPLKELKIEYTNYESKIKLANEFEMFLADARIIRLLPSFLSSAFQKRSRHLIQVHLDNKDLKKEFEKATSTTHCLLRGRGSTSQVVVGNVTQGSKFLAKNIVECFEALAKQVPGGLQNIRNVQIKCSNSPAVPIYASLDSKNDVDIHTEKPEEKDEEEAEDVATVMDGKVLVKRGRIEIVQPNAVKRKGPKMSSPAAKRTKRAC